MARGVGRPKKTDAGGAPVRKQRRKKDKNAPKRALSAFMFFSNDIRDTVKREMPELQFLQISMEIGRRWKEITAEDRRVRIGAALAMLYAVLWMLHGLLTLCLPFVLCCTAIR